jgi:hypothetical protein
VKKHLLIAAAMLAAMATPLAAKPTPVRSSAVWQDITQLEQDVNRADNRDTISEREAAGMRNQIADIKRDYHRMNANGLSAGEANGLENRIQNLRKRLHNERGDRDHHRG